MGYGVEECFLRRKEGRRLSKGNKALPLLWQLVCAQPVDSYVCKVSAFPHTGYGLGFHGGHLGQIDSHVMYQEQRALGLGGGLSV